MLEDLEGLEYKPDSRSEGISSSQIEYLSELDVPASEWCDYDDLQQLFTLDAVDGRMDELGVAIDKRSELAHGILSDDIADAYDAFIVENYSTGYNLEKQNIEAPHDYIQIEKIAEVLDCCEDIRYENWSTLELPEKESILNSLEQSIAEIECRPACPIHLTELGENEWGGYNPITKEITINSLYAERSDFATYNEIIDTLVHEGRHAYQDYNVNVAEIHPRHSEVASWSENMAGGKWGYWGDCSTFLGQRLYDQQSIEIDARNFAADVLDKLNLNA